MAERTDPAVRSDLVERNLLRFTRRLRSASIKVGTGQVIELMDALTMIGLASRDDVHAAARALLIQRPDQIAPFDAEFDRFWQDLLRQQAAIRRNGDSAGEEAPADDEASPTPRPGEPTDTPEDGAILAPDAAASADTDRRDEPAPDDAPLASQAVAASDLEVLRTKNFAQFTPEELRRARAFLARLSWNPGRRTTRRLQRANRGDAVDQRRMLRQALREGGVPVRLRYRRRKERLRPLVLICDISGSMDRYARMLLHFVHTLEAGLESVEVFVFSTRLTRITRQLHKRNVDQAIADVVNAVDDWSGGTRIGEAIRTFNLRWSRRVLRSHATVILISDGWDRGDPVLLGTEMARLQRSCRRLIWLNPLLGARGYQPLTQGIRAALPYVDDFLPAHNLESLEALATLLGDIDDQPPQRR